MKNKIKNNRIEDLHLLGYGIVVGIVAGLFSSFYRFIIHKIEHFLNLIISVTRTDYKLYPFLIIFCVFVSILIYYIKKYEPLCSGSGIPQVEAEIEGLLETNPLKVLFAKIFGGALTATCGFSVGREGPSIQIGAMCGKLVSKIFKQNSDTQKFLITCGASAGLSAAFNAPMSGILFAVEEVHKHITKKLLVVCMSAAIIADFISKMLYGTDTVFNLELLTKVELHNYWTVILFGIVLSFLGMFYIYLTKFFVKIQENIKINPKLKLIPYFVLPIVILLFCPYLLGGGGMLMKILQENTLHLKMLILVFIIKLLFSIISFTSGVPGGIFFPILVLGATIGAIFANVFYPVHINSFIILGMAGYLTAIVRAPLTATILIFEMTGNLSYLLPVSLVCLITYTLPNYLKSTPIYEFLLEKLLSKKSQDIPK